MRGKLIIITSDDQIKTADYVDYRSIQEGVGGGLFEAFCSTAIAVDPVLCNGEKVVSCDLYCNEEFFYRSGNEFDKANAAAMLLSNLYEDYGCRCKGVIRGNVVLVPYDEEKEESRGFDYKEDIVDGKPEEGFCECWSAEDTLLKFIKIYAEELKKIHQKYDNDKTIPKWDIRSI